MFYFTVTGKFLMFTQTLKNKTTNNIIRKITSTEL